MVVRLLLCGLQPTANPETAGAVGVRATGPRLLLPPWWIAGNRQPSLCLSLVTADLVEGKTGRFQDFSTSS